MPRDEACVGRGMDEGGGEREGERIDMPGAIAQGSFGQAISPGHMQRWLRFDIQVNRGNCTVPDHFKWQFSGSYDARERRNQGHYEERAHRREWRQRR